LGLLDILANASYILPTVEKPARKPSLYERLFWTGIVLVLYLVMANISLYGIPYRGGEDPLLVMRLIFASRHGTLMELGIGPIVTAGLIMQIIVGSKLISLDLSDPEERSKFTAAQKTLAVIFSIVEAGAYVFTGAYGPLNAYQQIAIITQLTVAAIIVILFDEMLQKGWGLGSGVSLFILAGVAEEVVWGAFSPAPAPQGGYWGSIVQLVSSIGSGTLLYTIVRRNAPDLVGTIASFVLLFILIYLEGVRIEIPVTYQRARGLKSRVPLKFIYVSNVPVLFASIFYSDLVFFSRILWMKFNPDNSNILLNIIGTYNVTEGGQPVPTGGLVYYMTPPRGLFSIFGDSIRVLTYSVMLIILSVVFGVMWVEISGMDPRTQAEQMIKSGLDVPGMRRSIKILEKMLSKYIYPLTVLSSLIVAIIAVLADILGALGTGMGLLLAVGIVYQYYGMISYERALEAYPLLKRLVGE